MDVRPSIRFFVIDKGKVFRVKEFFLDWFYTGFPKSLMKSLVDTYDPIESFLMDGKICYFGRDYKGRNSVSFYWQGTSVEIECFQEAEMQDFENVLKDLNAESDFVNSLANKGFLDRSFLASGGNDNWWEAQRISRMKWVKLCETSKQSVSGRSLRLDSFGNYLGHDGTTNSILILSDKLYSSVVWVDLLDLSSLIDHGYYKFRKVVGIFDLFEDDPNFLCHRSPYGPSILQASMFGKKCTISLTPDFNFRDLKVVSRHTEELISLALNEQEKLYKENKLF
ncbi:hypothetical protein IX51_09760 [uncultured archaeon]|nr:hypothetical protein IX51_09760 [uncultured archaeon]